MTDRPIIFSGPMVRALIGGRKTQTRRLATSPLRHCEVGDRLYVREAWACHHVLDALPPRKIESDLWSVRYLADDHVRPSAYDGSRALVEQCRKGRPSIHMPRWASRLTLTVSEVRRQTLSDISDADALAEGVREPSLGDLVWCGFIGVPREACPPVTAFAMLWESLHPSPHGWSDNPEIVALTFTVERRNIDAEAPQ